MLKLALSGVAAIFALIFTSSPMGLPLLAVLAVGFVLAKAVNL